MLYGYSNKQLNEDGLLELKEVTFMASPSELRQIAKFLTKAAKSMDEGGFNRCSHMHIENTIVDWKGGCIIVIPPEH